MERRDLLPTQRASVDAARCNQLQQPMKKAWPTAHLALPDDSERP